MSEGRVVWLRGLGLETVARLVLAGFRHLREGVGVGSIYMMKIQHSEKVRKVVFCIVF